MILSHLKRGTVVKKHLVLFTSVIISLSLFADDTVSDRIMKLERQLIEVQSELQILKVENAKLSKELSTKNTIAPQTDTEVLDKVSQMQEQVNKLTTKEANNNIKWGVDFRTSIDNINYKTANGAEQENNALFSNRLWLSMGYQYNKNLKFGGQLAYNKIFGQRSMSTPGSGSMDAFDWVSSENMQDDTVRIRSAYIDYKDEHFLGSNTAWSFGLGRRPSTNGKLISYRDDDSAKSPLGHINNAEFDGGNIKFNLSNIIKLDGSSIKFAAGKGMSNAEPRFSSTPYSDTEADTGDITMYAINLVPYNNKKVETEFQYTHANNLIDMKNAGYDQFGNFNINNVDTTMETIGSIHLASAFIALHGIGNNINNYLDNTIFFLSGAMSKTDPNSRKTMLGSLESENGYSYWIGTQMPSMFSKKGKWGIEFNHGSKYWRSFTYGEDTVIGSKIAVRGNAYELYFTEPLIDALSMQIRYTYIDYDYSGSNGFFGSQSGTPMRINSIPASTDIAGAVVDKAQDIRAYLRYKF